MRCVWSANAMACPDRARLKPVGWRCRHFVRYHHDCAIDTMGHARWRYATMATVLCPKRRTRSRRTNTNWSMPMIRQTFVTRIRRPARWAHRIANAMPHRRGRIAAIFYAVVGGTSIAWSRSWPTAIASSNGAARWRARSASSIARSIHASKSKTKREREVEAARGKISLIL